MKTDDEFVEEFRRIYLAESREEMSKEEAYDNFFSLVDVVRIVLRPLPKQAEHHDNPSIDGGRGGGTLDKNA
jgi:hypothetical protein